jgi:esterase
MILHSFRYPRDSVSSSNHEAAPKLIFLHGLGGNGSLWRPIAASLEEEMLLLCPDQRGHGESLLTKADTSYGPLDYAKDVAETAAAEDFSPAWVIGHSMGVRTACGYAKLNPERVQGLILVDLGFSGVAGGGIGEALALFLNDLPSTFPSRQAAKEFLAAHCPDPSIAQYLIAVSRLNPADGSVTFPFDQDALLKTIEASRGSETGPWMERFARETGRPVYILRGALSRVYKKAEFEAERERYASTPNIHFMEIEGAGHGLPFEKRQEFVAMIREWVS